MTLPTTGGIGSDQILAELGRGYPLNSTDTDLRTLGGVGAAMSIPGSFYGKSSYTPMSVTGNGDSDQRNSQAGAGTASCNPSVTVSGGSGGYTYNWVADSTLGSPVIGANGGNSINVRHSYQKNANGGASASFTCTVTDNTGHSVAVSNITAFLRWDGNQ